MFESRFVITSETFDLLRLASVSAAGDRRRGTGRGHGDAVPLLISRLFGDVQPDQKSTGSDKQAVELRPDQFLDIERLEPFEQPSPQQTDHHRRADKLRKRRNSPIDELAAFGCECE